MTSTPESVVYRRALRLHLLRTRRYWFMGGEVSVAEIASQVMNHLHELGVPVRDDDWDMNQGDRRWDEPRHQTEGTDQP